MECLLPAPQPSFVLVVGTKCEELHFSLTEWLPCSHFLSNKVKLYCSLGRKGALWRVLLATCGQYVDVIALLCPLTFATLFSISDSFLPTSALSCLVPLHKLVSVCKN